MRNGHNGGESLEFAVAGRRGFLVLPPGGRKHAAQPWVWYAPTFVSADGRVAYPTHRHDWLFGEIRAAGIAIGGLDIGESYGNVEGRRSYTAFLEEMVARHGLDPKPVLLAQSRGALMLYNWAVEHPDLCRAIAGIYPVVNLNTWPPDLTPAAAAYGLAVEEFRRRLAEFNPIDRLAALAKARVPVFHIHGDNDVPVPLDANSGELVRRYRALGGSAALVTVKGRGHEEVDEYFKSEALRDFIVRCAHDGSAERDRPDQEDG